MGESLASLELLIRGAAVGGFLGLGLCFARVEAPRLRLSGVLFCLSTAGHVLTQSPDSRAAVGVAFPLVWCLSVMGTALFWAFATDLFSDEPRPYWQRFGPAALVLTLGVAGLVGPPGLSTVIWVVYYLAAFSLMAHSLLVIAAGWRDDLVESRRRLRGPVLTAAAVYGLVIAVVEVTQLLWRPITVLQPIGAATLFCLSLAGMAVFLNANADLLQAASRSQQPRKTVAERALLARLTQAMDEEEVWRTEALTMFDLARLVGAPEHRLRRLINNHLGYRNFSAFLNERRIGAAKTALAHPDLALKPVSSVAYEVGFASLGPFNRAFKANTGQTPSEWRASRQERATAR